MVLTLALLDSTRDSWPRGVNCGSLYRDYTISSPPLASSSAWPAISCNLRTPCQVKATVGHSHGGHCIHPFLGHRCLPRLLAREPAEANVAGEALGSAGAGSGERRYSQNHGDWSGCARPWRGQAQGHSPPQGRIGGRSCLSWLYKKKTWIRDYSISKTQAAPCPPQHG